MPLSPDEQRILDEIEERLRAEDPRLADAVAKTSLQGHVARRIRLASVTFVVGFLTLMTFPVSIAIAAVGFALTAYPVGVERGWITRAQARTRTRISPGPGSGVGTSSSFSTLGGPNSRITIAFKVSLPEI